MGECWIGVTGLHATDNPQPGLAVIRALRRADPSWRVVALLYDRTATGACALDLVDGHALLPAPWAEPRAFARRLAALLERRPLDVIVPTTDAELEAFIRLRPALRRAGVHLGAPAMSALRAREKRRLPALGRRAGVQVPATAVLGSAEAVLRAASRLPFPQVVKGPHVDSAVARSPEDFRVVARELAADWGYPLLAQPLLTGEEYDVAVVARHGALVGAAVMKKFGVTGKGTAWTGVTVDDFGLVAQAAHLAETLRWDGAFEAEFVRDAEGRTHCFEINPRFPSWIWLAAEAGANLPEALVRLALGERLAPMTARAGRLFARVVEERTFPRWPLAGLEEKAWRPSPATATRQPAVPLPRAEAGIVGITGLNAADNPSPGLTVARALRALSRPPRLVGLTHEPLSTGAHVGDLWHEVRLLPFPSRDEGGYAEAVVEQCRAAGVDCLIPTLDVELPVLAWLAPTLRAAGVATLLPSLDALAAVAKSRLPALAVHGLRVPRTETVGSLADLVKVGARLGWPFVVKGPVADARVVNTEEEAQVVAHRLAASWGFPLLAQELVRGAEQAVAAVADRRHRLAGWVAVRKDVRTRNGNTWGATVVDDRTLGLLAARFAEALGWVGPFELEVIRHPRRGPFLIEVNPRFPAWVGLSAGAGANLPAAAVALARGARGQARRARGGTFYARIAWDVTAPVDRLAALAVDGRVDGHVD